MASQGARRAGWSLAQRKRETCILDYIDDNRQCYLFHSLKSSILWCLFDDVVMQALITNHRVPSVCWWNGISFNGDMDALSFDRSQGFHDERGKLIVDIQENSSSTIWSSNCRTDIRLYRYQGLVRTYCYVTVVTFLSKLKTKVGKKRMKYRSEVPQEAFLSVSEMDTMLPIAFLCLQEIYIRTGCKAD